MIFVFVLFIVFPSLLIIYILTFDTYVVGCSWRTHSHSNKWLSFSLHFLLPCLLYAPGMKYDGIHAKWNSRERLEGWIVALARKGNERPSRAARILVLLSLFSSRGKYKAAPESVLSKFSHCSVGPSSFPIDEVRPVPSINSTWLKYRELNFWIRACAEQSGSAHHPETRSLSFN